MADENADRVQRAGQETPVPKRDVEPFWPPEQIETGRPTSTPPGVSGSGWPGDASGWPPVPGPPWPSVASGPAQPASPPGGRTTGDQVPPKAPGPFVDDATRAWPLVGPAIGTDAAKGTPGAVESGAPATGVPGAATPHPPEPLDPVSPAPPPAVDLHQPFTLDEPVTMPFVPVQARSPEPGPTAAPGRTPTTAAPDHPTGSTTTAAPDRSPVAGAPDRPAGSTPVGSTADGTTAGTGPDRVDPDDTSDVSDAPPATGSAPVPPPLFHGGGPVPAESASGRASAAVSPWAQPPQRPPADQPTRATGTARPPTVEPGVAAGQAAVPGTQPVPPYPQQPGTTPHGRAATPPPGPQPGGWGVPQPGPQQPVGHQPPTPHPNGWTAPAPHAATYPV
ncbi:hypothetical protein GSF22_30345, partial [Micromonospora echinofusca]|nr:hypothetical protein [Micromonospora echinofusca]